MDLKPHRNENLYFALRILFSIIGVFGIGFLVTKLTSLGNSMTTSTFVTFGTYILVFFLYFRFANWIMIAYLKGNGILINENQFNGAYLMIQEIAAAYSMKTVPQVFIIQSGGALNAYAARFVGRNYVAIYSDVFSLVEKEPEVLKFILAHEFAHVKRHHVQKFFWTMLSAYVPFLGAAYSRSCEYTCDSYGNAISGEGAKKGLLLLASGKDLYNKVNIDQYLDDFRKINTFSVSFAEKFLSHPNLPNRIEYITNRDLI